MVEFGGPGLNVNAEFAEAFYFGRGLFVRSKESREFMRQGRLKLFRPLRTLLFPPLEFNSFL